MKLFDIDWVDFFGYLPSWERVTLSTRRMFARLKPNQPARVEKFGDELRHLIDSRFLTPYLDGRRAKLHKDCHTFGRVIRAMCRHDVLGHPTAETLCSYLRDHFTTEERIALCPDRQSYYPNDRITARHAMSVGWLRGFLALQSPKQASEWEARRLANYGRWQPQCEFEKELLDRRDTFDAAQALIGEFMSLTEPLAFKDLPGRFKNLPLPLLAKAVYAGMRYLLLFPTVRHKDMTPLLTLWPTIPQRLHRPKPRAPSAVTPDQTFECAFLMEDMTTLSVAAAGEPLRLRGNDRALFSKTQKQLESGLMAAPEWVASIDSCTPDHRVQTGLFFLQQMGLIETRGTPGRDLRIEPTKQAGQWLGMSAKDRLKYILDYLKSNESPDAEDYDPQLGFLPRTSNWTGYGDGSLDLPAAMTDAYGALTGRRYVPLTDFVEYHAQQANPLLQVSSGDEGMMFTDGRSWRQPTEEELESNWRQMLEDFFCFRLLPLACARIGVDPKHEALCMRLTEAGRYLLGLADDFDYGHGYDQQDQVVIQPNFEVVFLSSVPLAEAAIARFADRQAHGIGSLFKITKKSIFTAAGGGMAAGQVLDTLREVSAKAIPANVEREIKGWFDSCRRVAIDTAILIRCPDAQTATRVIAAGGYKTTSMTSTVVELRDCKFKTTLIRRLKDAGVFLDQASACDGPKLKRRRWRRSR